MRSVKWTRTAAVLLALALALPLCACAGRAPTEAEASGAEPAASSAGASAAEASGTETAASSAVILREGLDPVPGSEDRFRSFYEVFVRSFADADGDGIGDLRGLLDRLDYINDGDPSSAGDLGFDALWLMPICPSPSYHKYDVTDYCAVDPEYGSLEDFKALVRALKERRMWLVCDLVLNHSSSEHPWFKAACAALAEGRTDDPYVSYYRFSREKRGASDYPVPGAEGWFYEAVFWSGMPDFDLDAPQLRAEIAEILRFWLELGVDGFRLDAVTHYYEGREEENIAFLRWLGETARALKPEVYFVGEAWTDGAGYRRYYASGLDSFFDFDLADAQGLIAKAVNSGEGQALMEALARGEARIFELAPAAVPARFVGNHDMGRMAGYFSGELGKLKLAASLLLLSGGSSFSYYGDEIGMRGSGRDENKRSALLWQPEGSPAREQCENPPETEAGRFSYPLGSVTEQYGDPASLLNHYIAALRLRNSFPLIARGRSAAYPLANKALAAMSKADEAGVRLLLVFNFSAAAQRLSGAELPAGFRLAGLLRGEGRGEVQGPDYFELPPYSAFIFVAEPGE